VIVRDRAVFGLESGGRLLFFAAVIAVVCSVSLCAQELPRPLAADGRPLEFDVVSVRPNHSGVEAMNILSPPNDDGMRIVNMPLEAIIGWAYGITIRTQVSGMPEWAKTERFDIEGKVAEEDLAAFRKVSDPIMRAPMLQKVLADRFKMKSHFETRDTQGYALVLAKGGSKLTEIEPPVGPNGVKVNGGRRIGRGEYQSMGMWRLPFVRYLMQDLGCVVVDKTGLTGYYNYTLKWTPENAEATDASGPSIFTAVQEQLGLKLEPAKVPARVLVIDSIERPSEN
jgi:uncharacterized protein (TIGR03435 family)